jgi:disulfide bond formation protein DsbB
VNENHRENRTFLTSIFFLLISVVTLIAWLISPRHHLFVGTFGVLAFVIGVILGVYAAHLATEPSGTNDEMKTVLASPDTSNGGSVLVMRKAAGS